MALNYLICKGAIPIPSCTSVERADSIADVMDFELGVEAWRPSDEKLDYMDKQKDAGIALRRYLKKTTNNANED